MPPRGRALAVLLLLATAPLTAQRIDWRTRAVLYGDNTEFFTPYRTGETILGGQVTTWLDAQASRHTSLRAGLFADRRWGSDEFTDSLKPVLSARYQTRHSLGVMGTLDNERRHGLLDPLMVSTRELTTPIEYGLQWQEHHRWLDGQLWINWQRLNTPEQREAFELGAVLRADATPWLALRAQHLWSHRGGQLYDAGVPVTNNRVTALGAELHDTLPHLGASSLAVFELWNSGHLDPAYPSDRPANGHGTWLRAAVSPWRGFELFAIQWWGRDFEAAAGDANYGSVGKEPGFYRARRLYTELGIAKHVVPRRLGPSFDVEWRFHHIDHETSEAFFKTSWEISYRIVARVPVDIRLRR